LLVDILSLHYSKIGWLVSRFGWRSRGMFFYFIFLR